MANQQELPEAADVRAAETDQKGACEALMLAAAALDAAEREDADKATPATSKAVDAARVEHRRAMVRVRVADERCEAARAALERASRADCERRIAEAVRRGTLDVGAEVAEGVRLFAQLAALATKIEAKCGARNAGAHEAAELAALSGTSLRALRDRFADVGFLRDGSSDPALSCDEATLTFRKRLFAALPVGADLRCVDIFKVLDLSRGFVKTELDNQ